MHGGDVGALPIEVDEDHGLGQSIGAGARLQLLGQQRGVHVPGGALAVDEDGPTALVDNRVGAGREGERRDHDVVARADAGQNQRKVERGRARGDGGGIARANGLGKLTLKRIHMRAHGGNPVGGEGFVDIDLLAAGHVRRREVDARRRGDCRAHAARSGKCVFR